MDEPDNIVPKNKITKNKCFNILVTLDNVISVFVITPLVVSYWRGCWGLCDIYIYPSDLGISATISAIIGIILGIIVRMIGKTLENMYTFEKQPYQYMILSRTYIFIFCFGCINQWRGVWGIWDHFTGISWESAIFSTLAGILLLMATKSVNILMWTVPYSVCTDHSDHMYYIPTIYMNKTQKFGHRLLDVVYTVILILDLNIFVWRGMWTLSDVLIFPRIKLYSALGSLSIGLILTCLGLMVQLVAGPWLKALNYGLGRMIFEFMFYIMSLVAIVSIWRGYWYLLDVFLLSENFVLSHITSFAVGIGVLMFMFSSNSIMDRGAQMDSEDVGIDFQTQYLNVFYRKRLEKYLLKVKQLEQAETLLQSKC